MADRLATAIAELPSAYILVDRRLRVVYANVAAYALVGLARDGHLSLMDLLATGEVAIRESDREKLLDLLLAVRRSAESGVSCRARHVEAATVPEARTIVITVQPIVGHHGRYHGSLLLARDATAERELDRLKDELVANISHELQTPLASVRACAEMLLDHLDDGDPGIRDRLLGIVLAEAKQLSGLIENVLDLSRLEGGQLRPRLETIDLRWAVDDVVSGLEPHARARGQTISRQRTSESCLASADEQMVRVIVTNLIGNAIKHGREGGRVSVEVRESGPMTAIRVVDDGPGIPAEALRLVFERFYRVRSTTESSVKGAGLGLALVKGLTEAHGGRVEVESEVGHGAAFTVWLPTATRQ